VTANSIPLDVVPLDTVVHKKTQDINK